MDFDTAYIGPLIDEWLEVLKEHAREQESLVRANENYYMPFVAIPKAVVVAIFKTSKYFELSAHAKYTAVHLYDKFMCNYFWELYDVERTENDASWTKLCREISSQSKLYLMCCLQLASKMDSYSNGLTIQQVKSMLSHIDTKVDYTHNTIFVAEYTVFKTVGYKISQCTPLHCVEILLAATEIKSTSSMLNVCTKLLDLAYLQHEKLYFNMHTLLKGQATRSDGEKRDLMSLQSNFLFLSAAVVLCGTFFLFVGDEKIKRTATKLAELIEVRNSRIWDMANILLMMSIKE